MNADTLKAVIRHSILTALALDAVGHSFSTGHSLEEKSKWCLGDRTILPRNKRDRASTGKGGPNTELFCLVFMSLAESNPIDPHDIDDYLNDLYTILERYETLADAKSPYMRMLRGKQADGLLIPVAIAIGYYTAINSLPLIVFFNFCERIFKVFRAKDSEYDAALLLAFFIHRLSHAGYFGYYILDEANDYGLLAGKFGNGIKEMMEHNLDHEYLSQFRPELAKGCTYTQIAMLNVVLLMLRVDTAYPKELLCSLPREQIPLVFNTNGIEEADMGFIFGSVCTASEHKHPLVPKPLRESVFNCGLVDSALSYV